MPKRSSRDENEIAFGIVAQATGQPQTAAEMVRAVMSAMGRKGGKKGGKARAKALTPERRAEIATQAAKARWAQRKKAR